MKKLLLGGIAVLACVACSVGPDYKKPAFYTDAEIADSLNIKDNENYKQNNFWYKSFGDESLNRFVNAALINNYNLKSAIENVKQARYTVYINRAGFLPSFNAQGTYSQSNQNLAGSLPIKSDYFQIGADATWEIDIWGGQRRLSENAQALLAKASADFENVRVSLVNETVSQYVNWRLAQKLLHISEQNLLLQQDIFQTVEEKYASGLADDLDLEQAKEALNQTEMKIPDLKKQENTYKNALAILIGKLPNDEIFKQKSLLFETIPAVNAENIYNLPAKVISMRPDVVAAEQNLIAQNALIGNAVANLFPSVSLTTFLGWQNNTLSPVFGPDFNMYDGSGVVNLPILHWGSLINQVRIRESETKQAFYLYQGTVLTAISDVGNAIKNLEEGIAKNKIAQKNAESAKNILDLSIIKYENGLIDFAQVSQNEQEKLQSDLDLAQSQGNLYVNISNFYKAVANYSQKKLLRGIAYDS